jgi:hypothetical protein
VKPLKLAKEKSGTKFDAVALEFISQQFMDTGIAFPNFKSALIAERKKSADDEYLATVVGLLEEQLPHLKLTLNYEEADEAA